MSDSPTHRAIDAVWRIESPRIIARVARMVRDVALAEDFAHDALVSALETWPVSGVPDNPGAWLMVTSRRRAVDYLRRGGLLDRKHAEWKGEMLAKQDTAFEMGDTMDEEIGDDLLRLVFTTCHPVLSVEARVALTLRLLGGLTTEEIARGFLSTVQTVQQRIVRAKRTLTAARVSFEVPRGQQLEARLGSVLEVIYLIFNEGYSATAGDDWVRPALCDDALRLGRVLAELMPSNADVHGLVSLMEIQASRLRARVARDGTPILLLDQDRSRWDRILMQRGLAALDRAMSIDGDIGPYTLQAAIAACHARARVPEDTEWTQITALYDALASLSPSPIVELNRAVAYSMAFGPAEGLGIVDSISDDPALARYHLLPSVRGDLLFKLGRFREARIEFERAATLTENRRERELLLARAASAEVRAS